LSAFNGPNACTGSETDPEKGAELSSPAIRDAATLIVLRDAQTAPRVLMGQRGSAATFMPNKFVFPGGAVDAGDAQIALTAPIAEPCRSRLSDQADLPPPALVSAAIRELWEEAGLILGTPGNWPRPVPPDWQSYAASGHRPSGNGLHFVFRAITPPGAPRRFDARFFLIDADALAGDPDDFSAATDELSHLQWVPLDRARGFDLPFITEVVLAEVTALLPDIRPPDSVPFFNNTDEASLFQRLAGRSPLTPS